ncbi:hypothetical protein MTO96_028146 [Rhipicephalus appendiculatus]
MQMHGVGGVKDAGCPAALFRPCFGSAAKTRNSPAQKLFSRKRKRADHFPREWLVPRGLSPLPRFLSGATGAAENAVLSEVGFLACDLHGAVVSMTAEGQDWHARQFTVAAARYNAFRAAFAISLLSCPVDGS